MLDILPQLLFNSLITGSIYALASAGLALTFGLTRILNFAHGHIMMVGAYAFFLLRVQEALSLPSAALGAALLMVLLGCVSLAIFVMPFARISPLLPFVTTIALGSMLESGVSMVFGVNVRSFPTEADGQSMEWRGIYMTPTQLIIIASALCIFAIMGTIVHASPIGRRIRALGENPAAAEGLGISERGVLYGVFIVSTLLAAYAGVLVGYETNIQPTMGGTYSIKAFAAMILGGLGNMWGTVIGAYLLGLIENLSIGLDLGEYSLPAGYKDAFAFVIILVVVLVRPQGIFGSKARKA
jgi:branched-subunit amino acid ABC-type transport system permease component